ncbi:MAG: hypothetical protein ACOY90_09360 [Candidatus Zhuqueibacterota bacterium]
MRRVVLFAEDYAHETCISALVYKIATEKSIDIDVIVRNARGGHGKAVSEFASYLKILPYEQEKLPDVIIIAIDANCQTYLKTKTEIEKVNLQYQYLTIHAIPDPHIERWLLLDSSAFKTVLGQGCQAPDKKCEKNRYKRLLYEAVAATGVTPLLGGIEFAHDIISNMNIQRAMKADASLKKFIEDLNRKFSEWDR